VTGVPVLTAVTDTAAEAELVAAAARGDVGITVVRRCVDVADLLAAAATRSANAALVSVGLRHLDADAMARLAHCGVAVVALQPTEDFSTERRYLGLGATAVVSASRGPAEVAARLRQAALTGAPRRMANGYGDPAAVLTVDHGQPDGKAGPPPASQERPERAGRVVAVWGPTGAPGRTAIAVGTAAELAGLGVETLLVDADGYGGCIAQVVGLLDEAAGVAAAARLATTGGLTPSALAGLAAHVLPGLRVLTGIARAERWPELRAPAIAAVLDAARSLAEVTLVDCGFSLERDEEIGFDTATPRRNAATLACLDAADAVVAVGAADPVGMQRLIRGLAQLADLGHRDPVVVLNRFRPAVVGGGDARGQLATALRRYSGVAEPRFVPADGPAFDAALAAGRTLAEVAPHRSAVRVALRGLAAELAGVPAPAGRWRRHR
jgi:Flp pilus assembly CpaE family ATPase